MSTIRKIDFVPCRECLEPMNAILSDKVRHTCTPCGGVALQGCSAETLKHRQATAGKRMIETMREAKVQRLMRKYGGDE